MEIVVLGMHRSGSSPLTGLLGGLGCLAGPERGFIPSAAASSRGYWERRDVRALNEAVLQALGGSWYDVAGVDLARLPDEDRPVLEERARDLLREPAAGRPRVLADPRFCLLLPFWRPFLDRPVCLLVRRDPLSVARSLQARDGFPLAFGVALWELYTSSALAATRDLPRTAVSYDELVSDPAGTARRLRRDLNALGVEGLRDLGEAEARALIDPALDHHPAEEDGPHAGEPPLSPVARDLLAAWPRLLARRDELRDKIAADRSGYLAEREARLRGEETIAVLLAEIEKLREKIATDSQTYNAEREARMRGEATIAALLERLGSE